MTSGATSLTANWSIRSRSPHGIHAEARSGQYKVVTTAEEVFGKPTLTQHLTEDSKRSSTSETYFKVENYIPYADIYADLPYEQAEVEIFFMLDKNLTQAKIDYVNQNVIGITNRFRQESLDPLVKKWDMKTYTYSKSVSTSKNTGSSYPSSTYYYDQEGTAARSSLQCQ